MRSFIVYPLLALAWELHWHGAETRFEPLFLPVMVWGYAQYRLCGIYRTRRGGGGPGLGTPPQRLVTTGPYAFIRNPMYLGHIIYLTGLTLTLKSVLAALITVGTALWFHFRVLRDEEHLCELLGQPYLEYRARVKRWVPGLL